MFTHDGFPTVATPVTYFPAFGTGFTGHYTGYMFFRLFSRPWYRLYGCCTGDMHVFQRFSRYIFQFSGALDNKTTNLLLCRTSEKEEILFGIFV